MQSSNEANKTCLSDRPIQANSDALGNNKYALGLLRFIESADTPVTIGIQGGWGSGKTSLINILKHHLDSDGETLSVFVNAWEHSLFHNEQDKSSVAISLLSGVVESICEAIESKTAVPSPDGTPRISAETKAIALKEDSSLKKIGKVAVGLVALSARIGAKFVADVEVPSGGESSGTGRSSGAKLIRALRDDLGHAVKTVTKNSPYKRFVCFIDDLDRVHPRVAIEILDVLKNVFDVSDCVFVLAIDYDVVVKGLKDKFGEKTDGNEREYRQYFDKIIQVPFAMPVGAYAIKMESFLRSQFEMLNFTSINISRLAEVAFLATDGVPRGVKRIVNTLSLLMRIRELSDAQEPQNSLPIGQLEILFSVVALQINFPEIYRRLAERPNFSQWTIGDLSNRWQLESAEFLDEDGSIDSVSLVATYGDAFDEEWEQVIFLLCQSSEWLRQKTVSVSGILNHLRDMQNECEAELGIQYLQDALDAVNVTDVESRASVLEESTGPRRDRITNFCHQIHEKLVVLLKGDGVNAREVNKTRMWAKQPGGGKVRRYGAHELEADKIATWQLEWSDSLQLLLSLRPPRGKTAIFREYVNRNIHSVSLPFTYQEMDLVGLLLSQPASEEEMTSDNAVVVARSIADSIKIVKTFLDGFR